MEGAAGAGLGPCLSKLLSNGPPEGTPTRGHSSQFTPLQFSEFEPLTSFKRLLLSRFAQLAE